MQLFVVCIFLFDCLQKIILILVILLLLYNRADINQETGVERSAIIARSHFTPVALHITPLLNHFVEANCY